MAKEITKPFTGIGDLLSKLNSESKLLTEMYHYRTRLEFSYSHALELASSEKRLQMLIEYGILHRDGDNLEIDELFLRFFEEVLQSSEDISNATVEENLTKLQKNIEYYQKEQNNTEGQRYYLRMIRRGLVVIGSMVRRNVVTLKRNIDDVYKTIGNYATKRMRLEEYMQQLRSISLLIDETRKILRREDTTFRVMISLSSARLLRSGFTIARLRRSNSPTSRRSPFARWRRLPVRLQLTLLTDERPSATEEPSRRDCGRLASRLRHHSRFRIQRYLWTVER